MSDRAEILKQLQHLRCKDWNAATPEELADFIANILEDMLECQQPAQAQPTTDNQSKRSPLSDLPRFRMDMQEIHGVGMRQFLRQDPAGEFVRWSDLEIWQAMAAHDQTRRDAEQPAGLSTCPITSRPFFMNLEHPELGTVATYGGPFDSYTVPAIGNDDELRSERYDHDEGAWIEGGAPIGHFYKDQQPEAVDTVQQRRDAVDALRYRAFRAAGLPNGLGVYDEELDAECDRLVREQAQDAAGATPAAANQNRGHGHVFPRPDGAMAKCGGPSLCRECARDAAQAAIAAEGTANV